MPRRYICDPDVMEERRSVPVADFPSGSGPALAVPSFNGSWRRLGTGEIAVVGPGDGGAFAFGLGPRDLAVIWAMVQPDGSWRACCQHVGAPFLDASAHQRALQAVRCTLTDMDSRRRLFMVLASSGVVSESSERSFIMGGVLAEQLFTYSRSRTPLFGIDAAGCVGEPR
jgi:hypothetical protein